MPSHTDQVVREIWERVRQLDPKDQLAVCAELRRQVGRRIQALLDEEFRKPEWTEPKHVAVREPLTWTNSDDAFKAPR